MNSSTMPLNLFGQNTIDDPVTFNAPCIVAPPRTLNIVSGTAMQFPAYNVGYNIADPPALVRKTIDTIPANTSNSWKVSTPHTYENVSLQNPHPLLFQYAAPESTLRHIEVPMLADMTGTPVVKNGIQLRYFSFLPDQLSQEYNPVHIELWRRLDPRVENADLIARMLKKYGAKNLLPAPNSVNTRVGRARLALQTPSWTPARKNLSANELDLLIQMTPEQIVMHNTVMEVVNGQLYTPRKAGNGQVEYVFSGLPANFFVINGPRSIPEQRLKVAAAFMRRLQSLAFAKGIGDAPDNWRRLLNEDLPAEFHDRHQEPKDIREQKRQQQQSVRAKSKLSHGDLLKKDKRTIDELDGLTHQDWLTQAWELFPEDKQTQLGRTKKTVNTLQVLRGEKTPQSLTRKRKAPSAVAEESTKTSDEEHSGDDEDKPRAKRQKKVASHQLLLRRLKQERRRTADAVARDAEADDQIHEPLQSQTLVSKPRRMSQKQKLNADAAAAAAATRSTDAGNMFDVDFVATRARRTLELDGLQRARDPATSIYPPSRRSRMQYPPISHTDDLTFLPEPIYRHVDKPAQRQVNDAVPARLGSAGAAYTPFGLGIGYDLPAQSTSHNPPPPIEYFTTAIQPSPPQLSAQDTYPNFHRDLAGSRLPELDAWNDYHTQLSPFQAGDLSAGNILPSTYATAALHPSTLPDIGLNFGDMEQQLKAWDNADVSFIHLASAGRVPLFEPLPLPEFQPWRHVFEPDEEAVVGDTNAANDSTPASLSENEGTIDPRLTRYPTNQDADFSRSDAD